MDIADCREFCLSLPFVEETLPFDEDTPVYKVGGRMFAVMSLTSPDKVVVKCDPVRAEALRERYAAVTAAWHFNKKHWNALLFNGLPDGALRGEIVRSYLLVVRLNVTPRALRDRILAAVAAEGIAEDADLLLG